MWWESITIWMEYSLNIMQIMLKLHHNFIALTMILFLVRHKTSKIPISHLWKDVGNQLPKSVWDKSIIFVHLSHSLPSTFLDSVDWELIYFSFVPMRSLDGNELLELLDFDKAIEHERLVFFANWRLRLQEIGLFWFFMLVYLLDDREQRNYFPEDINVFDCELWLLG